FGREVLDPVGEGGRAGNVPEDSGAGRRRVAKAVLGLQEEDGHLLAKSVASDAVKAASDAGRDGVGDEGGDVGIKLVGVGHVEKVGDEGLDESAVGAVGVGDDQVVGGAGGQ